MERMKISTPHIHVQGNKTVVRDFCQFTRSLNRDPKHLSKYLTKKLATHGSIKQGMLELQGVFLIDGIKKEIENYLKEFVYCKKCFSMNNKLCPDTLLMKEGHSLHLKCEACGEEYPVDDVS